MGEIPPHPMAIVVGDYHNPTQLTVACENKKVYDITPKDIPIHLMALHYVINMCYPKGFGNF